MTTQDSLFIDAVIVKGASRSFSVSVNQKTEDDSSFEPLDLSELIVRFSVMGSPIADGEVLLEKLITTNTDIASVGNINNPTNGEFTFVINAEDTNVLGLGKFPIKIELLDAASGDVQIILTEGGYEGEFNAIQIVQV